MNPANILTATDILLGLLARAQAYANAVRAARAENRDLTRAELDELEHSDDEARTAGQLARAKAESEGR